MDVGPVALSVQSVSTAVPPLSLVTSFTSVRNAPLTLLNVHVVWWLARISKLAIPGVPGIAGVPVGSGVASVSMTQDTAVRNQSVGRTSVKSYSVPGDIGIGPSTPMPWIVNWL